MNNNYFEIFSIEPDLNIDQSRLRKTLYELSREYHPDSGNTQNLHTIAEINVAYEVLRNFKKRLAYLLFLYHGKECKLEVSADFLFAMLELNERIADWEQSNQKETERQELLAVISLEEQSLRAEYEQLLARFHLQTCTDEEVKSLESYLAKLQYLERLHDKLNQI